MRIFGPNITEKTQATLLEIVERQQKLERDIKSLQLEWENSYEKLRSLMGRVARRAQVMHDEAESEGKLASQPENGPESAAMPLLSHLTARQRMLQSQIMARRKNGGT
jgi:uncharacterized protein YaaN involved in tellurite resistance